MNNGDQLSDYQTLVNYWKSNSRSALTNYSNKHYSFVPNLLPELAVQIDGRTVLESLAQRCGYGALQQALSPLQRTKSPIASKQSPDWIKRVNMVGINVRTIQSFWNVVKYALTLPETQSSIHLLPMWEPGVVASLYGMASWQINPEFFSAELYHLVPQLDTVEKQLRAVVNLLHAMGKTVGMDVIPHTDRYSEMVLAQPQYFEWLRRKDMLITEHRANLHEAAQGAIMSWLVRNGTAIAHQSYPDEIQAFFGSGLSEEERLEILFGAPHDYEKRLARRASLVDWLFHKGYEPVPATMAPPYRGLEVDPDPAAQVVDFAGREWRDYRITKPEKMSRVFGPLTRFKFYERLNDNQDWEIDFSRPRTEVWNYFCQHYAAVQETYNLDFMRGDMSHVQMRPEGVPTEVDAYYDPLGAVKTYVGKSVPYFGYFAESFLAPPGVMAYGDEVDHLVASKADTTLGDLQSMVVGEEEFMANFSRYLQIGEAYAVKPNFTMITGDKDDPRFDRFYLHGNEARLFIGLFLADMPSYQGLGFSQRDPHPVPAPNEHYTKLYVFHLDHGPKATRGPYIWGKNGGLFQNLQRIRLFGEQYWPQLKDTQTKWLIAPDSSAQQLLIAWTQEDEAEILFMVNLGTEEATLNTNSLDPNDQARWELEGLFSSTQVEFAENGHWSSQGSQVSTLAGGECRAYKIK
ncbi:MAG: hypothetical protein AAFN81_00495 [Bacteroidota bacterium]